MRAISVFKRFEQDLPLVVGRQQFHNRSQFHSTSVSQLGRFFQHRERKQALCLPMPKGRGILRRFDEKQRFLVQLAARRHYRTPHTTIMPSINAANVTSVIPAPTLRKSAGT